MLFFEPHHVEQV